MKSNIDTRPGLDRDRAPNAPARPPRDREPRNRESGEGDRRRSRRAPLDVLANRFLDGYPYLCRATDISRQGMRLSRFNEPTSRTRFVGVQFQLPGSEEILTASGEVVFADQGNRALGIRFTHLSAAASAGIERYLSRSAGGAAGGRRAP